MRPPLMYVMSFICWKEEKKRGRKKGWKEGNKEESLVDFAGSTALVVKWTRFCETRASHALSSLSFLHFIFPHVFYLFRNISHLLLLLPGHFSHSSRLLCISFSSSLFRLLIFFSAFRNGRTLLRWWSLRGAGHFWPNGSFSRTMGLCKLNERDGRSVRLAKTDGGSERPVRLGFKWRSRLRSRPHRYTYR